MNGGKRKSGDDTVLSSGKKSLINLGVYEATFRVIRR